MPHHDAVSPTRTTFAAVQADRGWSLFSRLCCCRFYSTTCPDKFCSMFYAEIHVVVVESKRRVADFRQVVPLCVINLIRSELTDVLRTKRRWSLPKVMQIGSGFLKTWAVKRSDLVFGQKTYEQMLYSYRPPLVVKIEQSVQCVGVCVPGRLDNNFWMKWPLT